jgi:hypothetical protein
MKKAYICSPYRAKNEAELDRNIEYAQQLTKAALIAGIAPITPHLYMTQCLNESIESQREIGLRAGMEILRNCDFVIAGVSYGISKGMSAEIAEADRLGLDIVNADKLDIYVAEQKRKAERESWSVRNKDTER